jgi:hypothetical protein
MRVPPSKEESHVDARHRTAHAWFGASSEGNVPARPADSSGGVTGEPIQPPAGTRWLRRVGRILRDAILMAGILAMVPVTTVLLTSSQFLFWRTSAIYGDMSGRLWQVNLVRPFAVAKDPRITPMQAGEALAHLLPLSGPDQSAFPLRSPAELTVRPWDRVVISADMFTGIRDPNRWHGPDADKILRAAADGLSPQEMAFLKTVATAPLWPSYDLVARARTVDMPGGRFLLPYPEHVIAQQLPFVGLTAAKNLAFAGVSRAAYHLALGQRLEAEAALQSVIGMGFMQIDNGTNPIDGLVGSAVVAIGLQGLSRFYGITHDPRATLVWKADRTMFRPPGARTTSTAESVDAVRAALLLASQDAAVPRVIRYEALEDLSFSSCTNVRELVFGTGADITRAYDVAARDLVRYPSERLLLDMALHTTDRSFPAQRRGNAAVRVLVGAATVAGFVFDNPRLPFCTRAILNNADWIR